MPRMHVRRGAPRAGARRITASSVDRATLLQRLVDLQEALQELALGIARERALFTYVWQREAPPAARRAAAEAVRRLEYRADQDPHDTIVCPGLLGASPETLGAALRVNVRKRALRDFLLALADSYVESEIEGERVREEYGEHLLRKLGRARLHRIQAYREIPVLERVPSYVGFTWAQSYRVERLTRARLLELIDNNTAAAEAAAARERVRAMPDAYFARTRRGPAHVRVNVAFEEGAEREVHVGSLPLLCPAEAGWVPERLRPLRGTRGQRRAPRSDTRLEAEAWLPELGVYRYRKAGGK